MCFLVQRILQVAQEFEVIENLNQVLCGKNKLANVRAKHGAQLE